MTEQPTTSRLYQFTGIIFALLGAVFLAVFVQFAATGGSAFTTNGVGHYFVAFAGCGLLFWGLALYYAATDRAVRRLLARPCALALVFMGLYRLVATFGIEDVFEAFSYVPAVEAVILFALAFGFARSSRAG